MVPSPCGCRRLSTCADLTCLFVAEDAVRRCRLSVVVRAHEDRRQESQYPFSGVVWCGAISIKAVPVVFQCTG